MLYTEYISIKLGGIRFVWLDVYEKNPGEMETYLFILRSKEIQNQEETNRMGTAEPRGRRGRNKVTIGHGTSKWQRPCSRLLIRPSIFPWGSDENPMSTPTPRTTWEDNPQVCVVWKDSFNLGKQLTGTEVFKTSNLLALVFGEEIVHV